MKIDLTRRDVMKFAAGGALGLAASPAPWRLLDDLAIWTQNGSWLPRVPRGPVTERATVCSLCPAGCPARVRCAGGVPVQVMPAGDVPLCALGLTGHHLAWHPRRLTTAARVERFANGRIGSESLPVARAEAELAGAMAKARGAGGTVAVLDMRPGRSVSWAWRVFLGALPDGVLISTEPLSGLTCGIDLEAARTILSFGAPIAEGWGSPANLAKVLDGERRLIQVDPLHSRTATIASTWLPVNPGTDALVAVAICRELSGMAAVDAPELADLVRALEGVDVDAAARAAGVRPSAFGEIARALMDGAPSVAVGGSAFGSPIGPRAEAAIATLDAMLDAIGAGGCVVPRAALPSPGDAGPLAPVRALNDVPDNSIALLVVDASAGDGGVAWPAVARKLAADARVVALSPFLSGTALHADLVIPTAPYLEAIGEVPTPFDSPVASFAVSAPILPARDGSVDPVALIAMLAAREDAVASFEWGSLEDLVRARVEAILALGRGKVTRANGRRIDAADLDARGTWRELMAGGVWRDERVSGVPRPELSGSQVALVALASRMTSETSTARPLTLLVHGSRDVAASAVASPVMTQLYRESTLRRGADVVALHPRTASEHGLRDGREAMLETAIGRARVTVEVDRGIPPGVAVAAIAPTAGSLGITRELSQTILDICEPDDRGAWPSSAARLVEV